MPGWSASKWFARYILYQNHGFERLPCTNQTRQHRSKGSWYILMAIPTQRWSCYQQNSDLASYIQPYQITQAITRKRWGTVWLTWAILHASARLLHRAAGTHTRLGYSTWREPGATLQPWELDKSPIDEYEKSVFNIMKRYEYHHRIWLVPQNAVLHSLELWDTFAYYLLCVLLDMRWFRFLSCSDDVYEWITVRLSHGFGPHEFQFYQFLAGVSIPIGSMYGIYLYLHIIYTIKINQNAGEYTTSPMDGKGKWLYSCWDLPTFRG